MRESSFLHIKINRKAVILFCILLQSIGIRFFDGQGSGLAAIILLLSYKGFFSLREKDVRTLFLILIFLTLNKLGSEAFTMSAFIFQYILVLEAYIFISTYKKSGDLLADFKVVLQMVFLHAFIGYALYLVMPGLSKGVTFSNLQYRTFFYIFYVADTYGAIRNTGICWEPGLLQFMLNLLLFLNIKDGGKNIVNFFIVITIVSTFSTAGYIILGLNYLFYIFKNFKNKRTVFVIFLLTIIIAIPFGLMIKNIQDKFSGTNTSGLVRLRDFLTAIELIKEKPLLGHGKFDSNYLRTVNEVYNIERNIFTKDYLELNNEMSGGFTNGLLGLFCWYGIPAGVIIYFFTFKNRFVNEKFIGRLLFFLILCFSFFSEPITYTAFFFLFPFSYLILNKQEYPIQQLERKLSY